MTLKDYLTNNCFSFVEDKNAITVSGNLFLSGTEITQLPDNLTVGGYLDLSRTGITQLPDNLIVGDDLDLSRTAITQLPKNLTVGGNLDLSRTGITQLPDNLIVGGYLDLEDCIGITQLPDNLTVGGFLCLRGTGIKQLPDTLTVGGCLFLRRTGIQYVEEAISEVKRDVPSLLQWNDGKHVLCDGIFAEVLSHHGNVWKTHRIGYNKVIYIVTDGNGKYAHGNTIEEARKDLIYKISNRDKSKYYALTTDSVLTHEEAIEAYRVITGACSAGTRHFVENVLPANQVSENYTVGEIINLTRGQYGHEAFAKFFKR